MSDTGWARGYDLVNEIPGVPSETTSLFRIPAADDLLSILNCEIRRRSTATPADSLKRPGEIQPPSRHRLCGLVFERTLKSP